jgi:ADP-heptose:LPS heptosyltransferase
MSLEPKILVIRKLALGDVILTTPIVEQIYNDHKGICQIDVLTLRPEVFERNPFVRQVYTPQTFSSNKTVYDKTVDLDLAYEKQPLMHITDAYAMYALGSPDKLANKRPSLYSSHYDRLKADWLHDKIGDYIVVHMRHDTWPSRNIPSSFWRKIIDLLLEKTSCAIVQVGSKDEYAFDHDSRLVDVRGILSIHELRELIATSRLYVGIDSGTLHVAATTDTPIISLFTSAHHTLRKPLGRPAEATFVAVAPQLPCYGCQAHIPAPITGVICSQGSPIDPPCIHAFSIEDVNRALEKVNLHAKNKKTTPDTINDAITSVDQLVNYASECATEGFTEEALEILDKVITVHPEHTKAHIQRSFLRLRVGDYSGGAKDIDYIWKGRVPSQIGLFAHEDGSPRDLSGQTIVLSKDAGIGDLIQFVRYGAMLKSQGATVVVDCDSSFHSLLKGCEWIDALCEPTTLPITVTHRVPMHNLIGAFHTQPSTIPDLGAYIHPSAASQKRWKKHFSKSTKTRIGIGWRSENENKSTWTRHRTVPLADLINAFDPETYELVCLQKILNDEERRLIDLSPHVIRPVNLFEDLNETAAAISQLDAVVSSCTMLPHLSASMGIPTLLLLSSNPCWRWGLTGEQTPWYKSLTLLRQNKLGHWKPVIQSLKKKLEQLR